MDHLQTVGMNLDSYTIYQSAGTTPRTFHVERHAGSLPILIKGVLMTAHRRTIHYAGRVQGVGFRWTAVAAIRELDVAGYVKNLPDGRVELVLEGEPSLTAEAARRVASAMAGYIHSTQESIGPATGEFRGFAVRR
jgi:acylphosphatase